MKKAYLILNGDVDLEFLKKVISIPVFCTDGAYNKLIEPRDNSRLQTPDSRLIISGVIGDFDSVKWDDVKARKIPMRNQNFTDFEKALFYLSKKFDQVIIFGANGNEIDHVLGNLHAASKFAKKLKILFVDKKQRYFLASKNLTIRNIKGKTISIVPFPFAKGVTIKGFKWPLKNANLLLGKRIGIRNEAVNSRVKINYKKGSLFVIIST